MTFAGEIQSLENVEKNYRGKIQGLRRTDIVDARLNEDKIMMINHILPYFEMIEEYDICEELKNKIETI